MIEEKKSPPKNAAELLERYAIGDRSFRGADLVWANLNHANLKNVDLNRANLSYAKLRGAHLQEADIDNAVFNWADLSHSNLYRAILSNAKLNWARLKGANLIEADLLWAKLEGANLCEANLTGADLHRADLIQADLSHADLRKTDLKGANLNEAELNGTVIDGLDLSTTSFSPGVDLLSAKWETLRFSGKTFHRKDVESGDNPLPVGMGEKLAVLIKTSRLKGTSHEVMCAIADSLSASRGLEARVEAIGGGGTTIPISTRSRENFGELLAVTDVLCRLFGFSKGIQECLTAVHSVDNRLGELTKKVDAIVPEIDSQFEHSRRQVSLTFDEMASAMEQIGSNIESIRFTGLTDMQQEALMKYVESASEIVELDISKKDRNAVMTLSQKAMAELLEEKIPKPLRTLGEPLVRALLGKIE